MKDSMLRSLVLTATAILVPVAATASVAPELPSWMSVDHAAKTVSVSIVAGMDASNNHWNYNGLSKGDATIVVPVGYTVTVDWKNSDPTMMLHSIGVGQKSEVTMPMFTNPAPVFAGAISANAADPANATKSGEGQTITFVAETAGDYALICYVPGHTLTGMWIGFRVAADGTVGLE